MTRKAIRFLTDIDLNKNYLRKARFENLETAPSSPENGQVYYNTVDKCYYFYQDIVPTPAEAPFGEWVKFVNTAELTAALALKQDLLTAGEGISIEQVNDDLVISVDNNNSVYSDDFTSSDFVSGVMTIAASTHNCGTSPVLDFIRKSVGSPAHLEPVEVDYVIAANGDFTITVSEGFDGCIQLSSPYRNAAAIESSLNNILYGQVGE